MTKTKAASQAPRAAPFVPPYPASWFDRLKPLVERVPGPYWSTYLIFGLIFFTIEAMLHPAPQTLVAPVLGLLSVVALGFLLMMHALDHLAGRSFDASRPILRASDPEAQEMRYRLTTMPRGPALIAAGLGAALGVGLLLAPYLAFSMEGVPPGPALRQVFDLVGGFQISTTPASLAFNSFILLLTWCATGTLVYHTLRQLRWVSRLYTDHTRVDLLKPGPLYRLSRVTASTAIGLIVLIYLFFATDPVFFLNAINLASAAFIALLAAAAFVLPLLGIHRILVAEKEHLLDESSDRLKKAIAELHRRVDLSQLGEMDGLNKAIASLETERNLLVRIPTWPWQPESLRTVLGALLLPLLLWAAQAILGRLLAP